MKREVPAGDFEKVCPMCEKQFRTDEEATVYCSLDCRKKMRNRRYYERHREKIIKRVIKTRKKK